MSGRYKLWLELKKVEEERYRFPGTEQEWREWCKKAFFSGKSMADHLLELDKKLKELPRKRRVKK